MLRKLLVWILCLTISLPMVAQNPFEPDEVIEVRKNNAFLIGPKLGLTLTSMTQPSSSNLYDALGMGFSGGLAMNLRFGKATENSPAGSGMFGVGLELIFQQNSVKTIGTDENSKKNANISVNYFAVPVMLQIYPFAKSQAMNGFCVELGASLASAVGKSPKSLSIDNPKTGYDNVTYNIETNSFDIRPFAGIVIGIPNTGLDINARYYIGISDFSKTLQCQMSTIELSLSWRFKTSDF